MAFPQAEATIPSAIGDIEIVLRDMIADGEDPARKESHFSIQVLDASGEVLVVKSGDLIPHLDAGDVSWLIDFANRMRAKAISEILP